MGQLEEANTLTFSLELKTSIDNVYKAEEEKENNSFEEDLLSYEFTLAKTESGYDMMVESTRTENSAIGSAEITTDTDTYTMYLIDGVVYEYDDWYGGAYLYNPYDNTFDSLPDLSAIVDSFKTEEIEQFKAMLGEALTEVYNVTEGNISFAYDGKDDMNALIDYVAAIDPDTKTIESVLNDVLALIDEELTVAAILAEIEKLDTVTVGDAVAAIDAYLTENADTTLQGLKDEVLADERVVALLQEQGLTADEIQAAQDAVLADLLEPSKDMLLDEIVYNMVAPMLIGEFDPERDTYEVFKNEILNEAPEEVKEMGVDSFITYLTKCVAPEMLNMTISQIAGEDADSVKQVIGNCATVTMNEFSAGLNVEFNEYFQIETISANGDIEMVGDDEVRTSTHIASFAFSVDSISKDVTEIALPEDAETLFAFWRNDGFLENNTGISLWGYNYDAETGEFSNLNGSFYPDSYSSDYVQFSYAAPTEVTNTWEITITGISLDGTWYSGDELATLLDGELSYTLIFDYDVTGDYIVEGFEMPVVDTMQ